MRPGSLRGGSCSRIRARLECLAITHSRMPDFQALAALYTASPRQMAHCFNDVIVGIQNVRRVPVFVIPRSQSRLTVVSCSASQRGLVECIDCRARLGRERDMHPSCRWLALSDPELRISGGAESREPTPILALEVDDGRDVQGCKSSHIELAAARKIRNGEVDMVEYRSRHVELFSCESCLHTYGREPAGVAPALETSRVRNPETLDGINGIYGIYRI